MSLSEDKTLITHATTEKALFLGYQISVTYCDTKITDNKRSINGDISLECRTNLYMQGKVFT